MAEEPSTQYRKDYSPTPYLFDSVDLDFDLNEDVTTVVSKLKVRPNHASGPSPSMELNGRSDLTLLGVKVNGEAWPEDKYVLSPKLLTLNDLPEGEFDLEIKTSLKPQENTAFEGLYKSSGNYCTQCEAEGYRGITFSYDRPDVMSTYRVRIEADKEKYPVLLSNGNPDDSGDLENGRHFVVWVDPFRKPCYLFALVAGDFALEESSFTTCSGRDVKLRIFTQKHNIHKVDHAMKSLKEAMKWDEDRYGREYDLDLFNIVAVDDFNMGAMENKSLNVFNSKYVLALAETATDIDFLNIQGVVGHEYFHNWTGNRVTCRDWFQLTLKEGLTVFRDQEFSSDMNSRAVKRIDDVNLVRAAQFSEDAGPMSHPIRPDSYIKMDNFYTLTVYEKGAEIIRLYQTVLGVDGFRKGLDLYFERHDGSAVTCDDFLAAMADANGKDLSSLAKWYGQAGTPTLTVSGEYNEAEKTYTLKAKQVTPPTAGQETKVPVLIPIAVGLIGPDGKDIPIKLKGSSSSPAGTVVLEFDEAEREFVFEGVTAKPVPSILRDFSAPVALEVEGQTEDDLVFLFANDSNPFNRWEAGQRLYKIVIKDLYKAATASSEGSVRDRCLAAGGAPEKLISAFKAVLTDPHIDGQFAELAATMPSQSEMVDQINEVDPVVLHYVYEFLKFEIATELKDLLLDVVKKNDEKPGEPFSVDPDSIARRGLKNRALSYLSELNDPEINKDMLRRFREATNMTDSVAAVNFLPNCEERKLALEEFYQKWKDDALVCNKWLSMQAVSNVENNLAAVKGLLDHPAFCFTNPNCNYALVMRFSGSPVNFHKADGSGYTFFAETVAKLDKVNPQVAARIMTVFSSWRQVDKPRQALIRSELQKLMDGGALSENSFEVVSRSLK
ncbi:hypothetical protein BSKO_10426 [Bryopsis sp. KO-2023]|nr:hypothetical protein BSKO_10426 [Bryopsis sp. KO-2023]